jgi:hypothetical protein
MMRNAAYMSERNGKRERDMERDGQVGILM